MGEAADVARSAIIAAQANDLATRPSGRNWGRVPDDQVARLLVGADQIMGVAYRARINHLATELAAADETGERAKARVRVLEQLVRETIGCFQLYAPPSAADGLIAKWQAVLYGRPGDG